MKDEIKRQMDENLSRVENLTKIYNNTKEGRGRKTAHDTDVLRAAVVLLHASLEDCLRSIARWKLPLVNDQKVIDKFPFPSSKTGQRAEKVKLGFLLEYRDKSVEDLINQAIEEYLDRSSYNNLKEISSLIDSIGVGTQNVNKEFLNLEAMMNRRHMIVHRADRDDSGGRGNHRVKSIGPLQLKRWIESVRAFSEALFKQL